MRQLTDREQEALSEARQEYEPCYVGYSIEELAGFDAGFIAALDHSSAQQAALTAERDALAQQLKIAEEVEIYLGDKLQEEKQFQANQREVNAHLARERKKAEAERDALRVLVGRVVTGLPHASYYQYYGDTELRQLIKDCQKALGEGS